MRCWTRTAGRMGSLSRCDAQGGACIWRGLARRAWHSGSAVSPHKRVDAGTHLRLPSRPCSSPLPPPPTAPPACNLPPKGFTPTRTAPTLTAPAFRWGPARLAWPRRGPPSAPSLTAPGLWRAVACISGARARRPRRARGAAGQTARPGAREAGGVRSERRPCARDGRAALACCGAPLRSKGAGRSEVGTHRQPCCGLKVAWNLYHCKSRCA